MSTRKKIGMILVLVGLFWFLISFVLIPGYSPALGFIAHLNNMTTTEIVLKEGQVKEESILDMFMKRVEPLKNFSPQYEGRIAIPYKYLFILNIAIIFTGLGMLLLSSKRLQG
ncbi:MAG: hypothetical protein COZ31_05630 [Nitrospirae bacterium CG_4_10_14_3_um_filter_44_29]|nr:hypothetical protein [Nitrospirota bacterium]OIO30146.1 MAG: hypothetical protein AUJ60_03370 [Nitrospirae bacterium CG1_02_44_142]PIP71009.1 MAG: hypothetical protein COW90_02285 [Nitrospirae bacterium CG22_combo_CG10-13_8_21_14_all_44_11]PIV44255.1 MAG: hypothetical protein COS28_00885 [Nitrospirae bacterium CG02_land_8_20_14_3_00_44_33]PIV67028.1 MAG: hypothetical protein COS10_03205 [Nitrospirae bacterium CG01_land_8_20_14_3_00_44_22]PIW90151.1 MAG: hypothetical protein COZ93_02185 [Nit